MLRSIGFISCSFEEVVAFFLLEEVADASNGLPELVVCSGSGLSDQGFDLGECHLDGVQVGGVRRQEQEPGANVFQDRGGLRTSVGSKVVQYHDVALLQGRGQLGLDMEVEEFAVQRSADHPRRIQPVMAQGGDEGLSVPVAEGGVIHQTRSAWCPPGRLGHVGLEGSLVDECQPCQHVAHEGLAATDPYPAGQCDVRPLLLDRPQVFFCVSGQGRADAAKPRRGGPRRFGPHEVRPPTHRGSGRPFP